MWLVGKRITPKLVTYALSDQQVESMAAVIRSNPDYVSRLRPGTLKKLRSQRKDRRIQALMTVSGFESQIERDGGFTKFDTVITDDREKAKQLAQSNPGLPQFVRRQLMSNNIAVVRKGIKAANEHLESRRPFKNLKLTD